MYLKIKQGKYELQMRKINSFVLSLFRYMSEKEKFQEKDFQKFIQRECPGFQDYFDKSEKLQQAVEKYFQEPLYRREKVYLAMKEDVRYEYRIDLTGETLQEQYLEKKLIKKAAKIVSILYREMWKKHRLPDEEEGIQFSDFRRSLYEKNDRHICPVCLGWQDNLEKDGEIDHFFPAAKYPGLCFYPQNLSYMCSICNQKRKKQKDPAEKTALQELYLPYLRCAGEEAGIKVSCGANGRYVKMEPLETAQEIEKPAIEKRLKNYNRIYEVYERWNDRLDGYIKGWLPELMRQNSKEELRNYLEEQKTRKEIHQNNFFVLQAACYAYLSSEGFEALLCEWSKSKEEERQLAEGI